MDGGRGRRVPILSRVGNARSIVSSGGCAADGHPLVGIVGPPTIELSHDTLLKNGHRGRGYPLESYEIAACDGRSRFHFDPDNFTA